MIKSALLYILMLIYGNAQLRHHCQPFLALPTTTHHHQIHLYCDWPSLAMLNYVIKLPKLVSTTMVSYPCRCLAMPVQYDSTCATMLSYPSLCQCCPLLPNRCPPLLYPPSPLSTSGILGYPELRFAIISCAYLRLAMICALIIGHA